MDTFGRLIAFALVATFLAILGIGLIGVATTPNVPNGTCHSITEDSPPNDCKFTRIDSERGVWHK